MNLSLPVLPLPSPEHVARPLRLLAAAPAPVQRRILTQLLNRALATQRQEGELDFLVGRVLGIQIEDLGISWFISHYQGQLTLDLSGQADASIRGDWLSFARMAVQQTDPDTLFFQRQLKISGDTELGLAAKNLLDSIEEETLPGWLESVLRLIRSYLDRTEGYQ